MTLLDPPPVTTHKSQVWSFTIAALVLALSAVLYFSFRYYPEKKATKEFFEALVAGDTDKAYGLWKPTASYRKSDFLEDWGPTGYYGPVKSYRIMGAKAPTKSNSVEVDIVVSPFSPMPEASDQEKTHKSKWVTIWVSPADKSLSFPP